MKNKRIKDKLFGIVIGVLLTSTISYAAYKYQASEIGYTPSNENFKVDNVSDAIKELYEKYENGGTNTLKYLLDAMESSSNFLPTGYFKSTAADNNVIFGDYCWKIIRKNDDEDIRMIYNGTPTNGKCTKTGTGIQIDTSKYSDDSTITSYNNSTVKSDVDDWYNTNLATNYYEKISGIDLITREEVSNVGGGYIASGEQYWTQTPAGGNVTTTSSCSISTNSGGGCNATPSGNVSSSTVYIVDAEGNITSNNNGTYSGNVEGSCSYCTMYYNTRWSNGYGSSIVCGTGSSWCQTTTDVGCGCCASSNYTGTCTAAASGSSLAVRPVLTLKNTVTLQGGQGTASNPYYLN